MAAKPRPRKAQPMPDALPTLHKPESQHNQDDNAGKDQLPAMDLHDAALIYR